MIKSTKTTMPTPQLYSVSGSVRSGTVASGPTIVGRNTKKLEGARNGVGRAVPQVIPSISDSGRGYCGTQSMPKPNK